MNSLQLLQIVWTLILIIVIYLIKTGTRTNIIYNIIQNSKQKKIDSHLLRYRESLVHKRTSAMTTVIPLLITLIVAFVIYKYIFFAVPVSNSMLPTFARGDLILYQKYNRTPEVGDIIMFKATGKDKQVTHRVYSIRNNKYIRTKGDNGGVDPWQIEPQTISAKAVIIRGKPIVIKYVGSYLTGELQSGNKNVVFDTLSAISRKTRELGLLIFSICVALYLIISAYDMSSKRRYKRR